MNWKRARTDERKNERKEAIYDAAYTLFKAKGYDKVSFNGIASEAGFTKSNMYRYFSSKEEIFLNVFASLFEQWFDNYCARLQKLKENECVDNFTEAWVGSFSEHPKLMDLMPILFSSLEKNSSYEQLQAFKRLSKNLLYRITLEISRIYPSVQGEKAFKFLNLGYAATVNCWTANSQSEALKKLYEDEEFKDLKPNFEYDLSESITIVIRGLKLE
ncbi:TetR/AcrR family transcriptional regulator [Pseudoalteromonas sp. MMG005]|uniref:TetR/AcrR family transcriptional regulator n=1 Tax=Pseudoalteromonas sp. MMG005 TaxID=2822682 RepID=UPI001B3A20E0|nr:TetR/AcrR family transcriptional regulator [Pseudoalteromonas sp. MMG005]MBQ4848105.1 TetR/AcrR family transcriptional regulator [Pseudoalteromonas sp. MMG005]